MLSRSAVAFVFACCCAPSLADDPREPFESELFVAGEVVELPAEELTLAEHPVVLDDDTFSERVYGGAPLRLPSLSRTLEDERLLVRMPGEREGERPPRGVLLWVHADAKGVVPAAFAEAADALNLVIIAPANVGNGRAIVDRMQVCLDAVETVRTHVPVDDTRVFVTGISGGGRVSSMLHVCFPDHFAGSVPIVGVACYDRLRMEAGRYWPAGMAQPRGERWRLLREQRIAPISGPPDFNHDETAAVVKRFVRDGLDARYFEYPDQEHTLPTSERFAEALAWVNEAWGERREERIEEAERLVASVEASMERLGREAPSSSHRRRLERALETAPWSAPGDRARALLEAEG